MSEDQKGLSVRLPVDKFDELAELADRTGIVMASLVRSWIYEKLDQLKVAA